MKREAHQETNSHLSTEKEQNTRDAENENSKKMDERSRIAMATKHIPFSTTILLYVNCGCIYRFDVCCAHIMCFQAKTAASSCAERRCLYMCVWSEIEADVDVSWCHLENGEAKFRHSHFLFDRITSSFVRSPAMAMCLFVSIKITYFITTLVFAVCSGWTFDARNYETGNLRRFHISLADMNNSAVDMASPPTKSALFHRTRERSE